ncbi:polycystin-2-like protein 2 isoform X3 [Paroedura picta]|uniref:polycystin-2-like protein 2 isoform X3 n=1 Tax=Paroedura picta TaxID=143630 RepID=UPI004055CCC7
MDVPRTKPAGQDTGSTAGLEWRGSGVTKPRLSRSRELEMKTTLQELLFYVIFLTDLCILTFGMVSTDMYYLNKVMSTLFLDTSLSETDNTDFKSIASVADFWKYAEGPLLDGLYWDTFYPSSSTSVHRNTSHIYYENLLLGVAQVRQLKIRNDTCSIYPSFRAFMKDCYGPYNYQSEDKEPFGLKNDTEWRYSIAKPLSLWHWGRIGLYSSGGFTFTLPKSKNASIDKLSYLKEHGWLTRGTRVVFIDFSMYNANVNLFCVVRLVLEFPATGGILPSWQFYSVKLLRYVTYYDYFLASCEVIFCLFILSFIIQEFIKMKTHKKEYVKNAWNWLDVLLILLSVFAIAFNVYRTMEVARLMENLLSNSFAYPDFYFLAFWQTRYNNMISVNVFFAWIKNMFLAIINDTYSEVKADFSVVPSREFEISDLIRQSYNKALVKLKLKSASQTEDLYAVSVRRGQSTSRTDMDSSISRSTNAERERRQRGHPTASSTMYDSVSPEEFQRLSRYTAELEKQLKDVTTKLDLIMKNLPEGPGSGDKK